MVQLHHCCYLKLIRKGSTRKANTNPREHADNLLFLMAFILFPLCRSEICMCGLVRRMCMCVRKCEINAILLHWGNMHFITSVRLSTFDFRFHSISVDINCAIKKWGNVTLDFSLSDLIESDRPPDMTKPQALGAYVLCVNVCSHRPRMFNRFLSDTADSCVYSSLWPSRHDTFTADINTIAMLNHHAPLR